MIEWLSKKRSDEKCREDHERDLRKSLAKKLLKYEYHKNEVKDDFTELIIKGKKLRVAKEQITLDDI